MRLQRPRYRIITIAGTNGKGSTVALLEGMLLAAGYKTGAYTSPHFIDYNERVRINGRPVSDARLCEAFERIEAARGNTPLTYFEYGTVAAIDIFSRDSIDIALLEVGMGGRLDAVNALDADIAVVTRIGIDHTAWLGTDRETIAREKAGIFRAQRPAICCDPEPPITIAEAAEEKGAQLLQLGRDFHIDPGIGGWAWRHAGRVRTGLPFPAMRGAYQVLNAAGVLMALETMMQDFPVSQTHIRTGLLETVLPGRFQTLPGTPVCVLDVAHNLQAAQALAQTLALQAVNGRTLAVVGMLRDKPLAEILHALSASVDCWYPASLPVARGASAEELITALKTAGIEDPIKPFDLVTEAYAAACCDARSEDRIVVFGSFYTVSDILRETANRED